MTTNNNEDRLRHQVHYGNRCLRHCKAEAAERQSSGPALRSDLRFVDRRSPQGSLLRLRSLFVTGTTIEEEVIVGGSGYFGDGSLALRDFLLR